MENVTMSERCCPVCGERMHLEKEETVTADVCPTHGVWLDHGELKKIILIQRAKGLPRIHGNLQQAYDEGYRRGGSRSSCWGDLLR